MAIHQLAEVHPTAKIAESAEIMKGAYIGPNCVIHDNVKIGMNTIVEKNTEIGEGSFLYHNVLVGGAPQDYSYNNEETFLKIGKNTIIREFTSIHRATTKEDLYTEIGDNCFIMASSHIGHDCKIGNNVTITSAMLPGHIHVDDFAIVTGMSGIHQGVHIGKMAFVAGVSHVSLDVPPYCIVGNAVKGMLLGLNIVGLQRRGVSSESRLELKRALKILLNKKLTFDDVKKELLNLNQLPEIVTFREFIEAPSRRGITRS